MVLAGKYKEGTLRHRPVLGLVMLAASALAACSASPPSRQPSLAMLPPPTPPLEVAPSAGPRFAQQGVASWYGKRFHHKRTASGEHFDMHNLTAAHRSLPLDTVVRVTNLENQRRVLVRINDRGPFKRGRVIDLSAGAAEALEMTQEGVVPVLIEVYDIDQMQSVAERLRVY